MFRHTFLFVVLLGLAFAIPYGSSRWPDIREKLPEIPWWSESAGDDEKSWGTEDFFAGSYSLFGDADEESLAVTTAKPADSVRPRTYRLEEVLRFDMPPAEVLSRWPRVVTRLASLDLQGLRVPLVSGKGPEDVAGSLTYYFDNQQKLQRLALRGHTGDTRRLVNLVVKRFGFQRHPSTDPHLHLFQVRWNGEPRGQLWIQAADIVDAADPLARFEVKLTVDRPSSFSPYRPGK